MIEIKNISKTYNGEKKALNQVSFDIKDGEIFVDGIQGCCGTGTAGGYNCCSRFVDQISTAGAEHAVQEGQDGSVGRCVINRRSYDQAIGRFQFVDYFIHTAVKEDAVLFIIFFVSSRAFIIISFFSLCARQIR